MSQLEANVDSMSDLFYEGFSDDDIAAVFGVMAACPHLTFQVLTKRAARLVEWFAWVQKRAEHGLSIFPDDPPEWRIRQMMVAGLSRRGVLTQNEGALWPLPNVWLGVSVEDQQRANERIPHLLRIPAAVRFVSYEPALGPVDFAQWLPRTDHVCGYCKRMFTRQVICGDCDATTHPKTRPGINWLIVGGESGPGARPFDLAWARAAVQQCQGAGVPVFVKQLGPRPTIAKARRMPVMAGDEVIDEEEVVYKLHLKGKGGDMVEWPEEVRVREFPR